jgi:hypothetical protein
MCHRDKRSLPATYFTILKLVCQFFTIIQIKRAPALTIHQTSLKIRNTKSSRKNAPLNIHRGSCRFRQCSLCSVQLHHLLRRLSSVRRDGDAIELVPRSAEYLPRDLPKRSDLSQ